MADLLTKALAAAQEAAKARTVGAKQKDEDEAQKRARANTAGDAHARASDDGSQSHPAGAAHSASDNSAAMSSQDHEVLVCLVRDHLNLNKETNTLLNSKMLVALVTGAELQCEIAAALQVWHKEYGDWKKACEGLGADAKLPPCPVPYRKQFCHQLFAKIVSVRCSYYMEHKDTIPDLKCSSDWSVAKAQETKDCAEALVDMTPEQLDQSLGEFEPKYAKAMPNRPWVWKICLTDFAPESVRASWWKVLKVRGL